LAVEGLRAHATMTSSARPQSMVSQQQVLRKEIPDKTASRHSPGDEAALVLGH
jgi:hypothetical protein